MPLSPLTRLQADREHSSSGWSQNTRDGIQPERLAIDMNFFTCIQIYKAAMLHDRNRFIQSSVKEAPGLKACLIGEHVQQAGKQEPWFSHRSLPKSNQQWNIYPSNKNRDRSMINLEVRSILHQNAGWNLTTAASNVLLYHCQVAIVSIVTHLHCGRQDCAVNLHKRANV